ncbi:Maf family protein [Candidatus Soleaferrea massiliensis]|uniref:Maf family protein n=1 Tax=Candidatus Soleaferrea massiliensis TaxID=1470354 RepID=UPI00058AD3D1|nr:Maf family protein [Candidatus Soleaferrea massiliensis]
MTGDIRIKEPVLLASQSPRRQELIRLFCEQVSICPSRKKEQIPAGLLGNPGQVSMYLARLKAEDVAFAHPDEIVIGSDTIVCAGNEILGKPKDEEDAVRMLSMLSGIEHQVYTGVCIVRGGISDVFFDCTLVRFHALSEQEIRWYIGTGEPFDKAGAYGIQGKGALLVEKIDGDYYNVMGFPVGLVYRRLKAFLDRG